MANKTIDGYNVAVSIDGAADQLLISQATVYNKINRNTLLNLTSGPVGLTDIQTLTNKTLTSPTINGGTLSGTLIGTYTLSGTPTFPASVITLTGTQVLTNKTLTSPTINTPTITNASITQDAVTGFSTANSGTVYGIAVTAGVVSTSSVIPNNSLSNTGSFGAAWAWSSWVPTWTNFTPGNAVVNARYTQIGKTIHVNLTVTLGTTSVMSIAPNFTLPVAASANYLYSSSNGSTLNCAYYLNPGVASVSGLVRFNSSTIMQLLTFAVSGSNIGSAGISATVPFTWANGIIIICDFTYEAT